MSFIQWCCERGAKSHRKSTKKPWRSRSLRYSFHKHFTFFYLFLFFNYFTLSLFFYTFFTHDIYPHPHLHPHPRPTTSIHDPREELSMQEELSMLANRLLTTAVNVTKPSTRALAWPGTLIVRVCAKRTNACATVSTKNRTRNYPPSFQHYPF